MKREKHLARILKQANHYAYLNHRMLDDNYDDEVDLDKIYISNMLIKSWLVEARDLIETGDSNND